MDANDLMNMLDIDDTTKAGGEVLGAGVSLAPGAANPAAVAETALAMDKWTVRRGAELLAESIDLRKIAKLLKPGEGDDGPDADVDGRPVKKARKPAAAAPPAPDPVTTAPGPATAEESYWAKAVADFHAASYEPDPVLNPACVDPLRHEFVKGLMETPDFAEIRQSTVLNPMAAEIATTAFAKQFSVRLDHARAAAAKVPPAGGKGAAGKGKGKAGSDPGVDAEIATMRAVALACKSAKDGIDQACDAGEMCGMGGGGGDSGRRLDPKRLAAVQRRVKSSRRLQQIAAWAGRFRRVASSKQRMKVTHGADEVVGITFGDDLSKLVPAELLQLTDDDYDLDAFRRLTERQCMQYQTKATEPVGKGPIVITVDESGSMDGPKIETAKGLALALAWIAKKQRRWCVLVGFSGGTEGTKLLLPPGRWDETALLDWLEHFFSHGTDMDVPLEKVPGWWPEFVAAGMGRGKTDIVMITDAECRVSDQLAASFNAFKAAEKVRLTCLVVQGHPGSLDRVADEVYELPALTVESDVVGSVLSV